ncbi:alpha/beta hydrolase [Thauera sp. SDU_THAU2]|uniref:alpha/beta hydrolase n=1 Tax=Thauera sp. SDU_THAU2 TaxID=3136633 RepID=UPI00311D6E02
MHATRFVLVLISTVLALCGGTAIAQPSLERGPGPDITERGSVHYRFETLMLDAPGSERRYRIQIAQPRLAPPAAGYPAIFLLDGNAAIEALDDELLGELAAANPPVIVAIGYDTPLRFDVVARAYDYTPPLPGGGPQTDPLDPTRTNGGAVRFLDFIQTRVKPELAARVPLDAERQGVWGHSYGGLFVLHTLLTQPAAFSHYAAASPALWWRDGHLLTLEEAFGRSFAGHHAHLLVLRGGAEGRRTRPAPSAARLAERERATAAVPADAVPALVSRLDNVTGLDAQYRELPDLEHGPMLPASLGHALRWMAGAER